MGAGTRAFGGQAGNGAQRGRQAHRRAGRPSIASQADAGQEGGASPADDQEKHEAALSAVAWAFLAVAAVAAVGDWIAVARGYKPLEYVCKPAVMAALIGVALTLDPTHAGRRDWFVVALALSMLGDVFLMVPRDLFVAGLASFLLAHIAYVVGFRVDGSSAAAWAEATVAVLVVDVVLARPVLSAVRRRHGELLAPVAAYMVVIAAMVAAAVATGIGRAIPGADWCSASEYQID